MQLTINGGVAALYVNTFAQDEDLAPGLDAAVGAQFSAMALGDRLKYLRWLLGHADKLQQFQALYDRFESATSPAEKLRIAAETLLLAAEIAEDLPTTSDISVLQEIDVQALARRLNIDWAKLRELAEWLIPILIKHGLPALVGLPI